MRTQSIYQQADVRFRDHARRCGQEAAAIGKYHYLLRIPSLHTQQVVRGHLRLGLEPGHNWAPFLAIILAEHLFAGAPPHKKLFGAKKDRRPLAVPRQVIDRNGLWIHPRSASLALGCVLGHSHELPSSPCSEPKIVSGWRSTFVRMYNVLHVHRTRDASIPARQTLGAVRPAPTPRPSPFSHPVSQPSPAPALGTSAGGRAPAEWPAHYHASAHRQP